MPIRVRQALAILFILGFLVSAPLVVLYTAGYRLNVHTGHFVQTGDLSIGSIPHGANIKIDGKLVHSDTPTLIKDLLPGSHLIELDKVGYLVWQKMLPITSNQTTFIVDAALNANAPATLVRATVFTGIGFSSSTSQVAYEDTSSDEDEIWSFDPRDGSTRLLARFPHQAQVASLTWSPDGSALCIIMGNTSATDPAFLVSADGQQRTDFDPLQSLGWDAGQGARYLLTSDVPNSFQSLSVDGQETTLPITSASDALQSSDDQFVLAQSTQNSEAITVSSMSGPVSLITYLPPDHYAFVPAPSGLLMLTNTIGKIFVLDSNNAASPLLLTADATSWQWEPGGRRLLYTDGFELHAFDPDTQTDETLTRVSDPITGIAWRPNLSAALYAQAGQLTSIEFDHRDGHVTQTLLQGANLQTIWTDAAGKNVYFFGTVNGQSGLYVRPLEQ